GRSILEEKAMSIRNAGGLPPTPSDVPEVAPTPAQGVPGAARAFDLAPPFAAVPEFAEIRDGAAPLAVGARGDAVKVVQETLQELGSLPQSAAVDGIFGRQTAGALAAFQKQTGLEACGP